MNIQNKIVQMTVKDLINLSAENKIVPYANNRGVKQLNKSRITKMVAQFDPSGLCSSFVIAEAGNGKYIMFDGHHRLAALNELNRLGKAVDLYNQPIHLTIADSYQSGISIYKMVNKVDKHNGLAKATNPDLFIGDVVDTFRKSINVTNSDFPLQWNQFIFDIISAYIKDLDCVTWESVWQARKITTTFEDKLAGNESKTYIPKPLNSELINAFRNYYEFQQFFIEKLSRQEKLNFADKKIANEIVYKTPGFMFVYILDILTKGNAFGGFTKRSKLRIVESLLSKKKMVKILGYSKNMAARRGSTSGIEAADRLRELLK